MAESDFRGIISEIRNGNQAPSFKLFRLLYEDVINGLWAQTFASDDVIKDLLHSADGRLPGARGCWTTSGKSRGLGEERSDHRRPAAIHSGASHGEARIGIAAQQYGKVSNSQIRRDLQLLQR